MKDHLLKQRWIPAALLCVIFFSQPQCRSRKSARIERPDPNSSKDPSLRAFDKGGFVFKTPTSPRRTWSKEEIHQKVLEILENELEVPTSEIKKSSLLIDDLGADSLDLTELTLTLDDEFEIVTPCFLSERMYTVDHLVMILDTLLNPRITLTPREAELLELGHLYPPSKTKDPYYRLGALILEHFCIPPSQVEFITRFRDLPNTSPETIRRFFYEMQHVYGIPVQLLQEKTDTFGDIFYLTWVAEIHYLNPKMF